jgi:hypothetical protein
MQLAGELAKINLPSLIQLIRNGELTGKVCLTQGANTAFIFVEQGRLIHVESDSDQGRAGLLELFLWPNGTFSFVEADVASVPRSFSPDEPIDKIVREGVAYSEKKKHLDQLRITSRTVLQPAGKQTVDDPIFQRLDGVTTLGEIATAANMRRFDYIQSVYNLVVQGLVVVVEASANADQVNLPAWVVSRLKQDNPDLTQSIVQMVIWVDRVKCWMYQADADMEKIIAELSGQPGAPAAQPPSPPTPAPNPTAARVDQPAKSRSES